MRRCDSGPKLAVRASLSTTPLGKKIRDPRNVAVPGVSIGAGKGGRGPPPRNFYRSKSVMMSPLYSTTRGRRTSSSAACCRSESEMLDMDMHAASLAACAARLSMSSETSIGSAVLLHQPTAPFLMPPYRDCNPSPSDNKSVDLRGAFGGHDHISHTQTTNASSTSSLDGANPPIPLLLSSSGGDQQQNNSNIPFGEEPPMAESSKEKSESARAGRQTVSSFEEGRNSTTSRESETVASSPNGSTGFARISSGSTGSSSSHCPLLESGNGPHFWSLQKCGPLPDSRRTTRLSRQLSALKKLKKLSAAVCPQETGGLDQHWSHCGGGGRAGPVVLEADEEEQGKQAGGEEDESTDGHGGDPASQGDVGSARPSVDSSSGSAVDRTSVGSATTELPGGSTTTVPAAVSRRCGEQRATAAVTGEVVGEDDLSCERDSMSSAEAGPGPLNLVKDEAKEGPLQRYCSRLSPTPNSPCGGVVRNNVDSCWSE